MRSPLMLEGQVTVDSRDEVIASLRTENARMSRELSGLRESLQGATNDLATARVELNQAHHAIGRLRTQLAPLYRSLQLVFGELEAAGVQTGTDDTTSSAPANSRERQVWESWKKKLGGKSAELIDALLEHGEMTVPQLRVAAHCGQQTVYDITCKLNKLGLLQKNGGKYSLRAL